MKYHPIPLTAKRVAEVQRLLYKTENKVKASVTLSGELVRATDAIAGAAQRSAFVERALRHYLKALMRRAQHEHDLAAIDANAAASNRESDALLAIQAWPK